MAQGISAHGTIIYVESAPGGALVEISELGDLQMPGLTRNTFDITSHNRDIDTYVAGVARREEVTFPMFFNKAITSQVLLRTHLQNNTLIGFKVTGPDGDWWYFSGNVVGWNQTNPVDGVQTANVTIRPSGEYILNGIQFGA
jgi:hypothetical protein